MYNIEDIIKNEDGTFPSHAWPGGYPFYYHTKDGGILCPKCVNDNIDRISNKDDEQWYIIAYAVNWEDPDIICDHCNEHVESAYEE